MGREAVIKGLHIVARPRKGKPTHWHVYAWRGGPCIMRAEGARPERLTDAAVALYQAAQQQRTAVAADTVQGLASTWRASAAWAAMAPTTRRQWAYVLADIETKWGQVPLAIMDDRRIRAKIITWRDGMAATPRKADYRVQVLSAVLGYGRMLGRLTHNHAEGIPQLYKGGQRSAIIWTADEVAAWQHTESTPVRDAVNLARLTGLRRGDLITLPLDAVGEHAIVWRTGKSGKRATVSIPMLPDLAALVADLRTRHRADGVTTLLVNSLGRPWTANGLTSSFTDARKALDLPEKHLHDFRGTYCTELCRARLSNREIARIMGWTEPQVDTIRTLYVDEAAVVVAIGQRLAGTPTVNAGVNQ